MKYSGNYNSKIKSHTDEQDFIFHWSRQWDSRLSVAARLSSLSEWLRSLLINRSDSRPILFSNLEKKKAPTLWALFHFQMERAMGLEPTTAAMARRYSSQLSYAREMHERILYIFQRNQVFVNQILMWKKRLLVPNLRKNFLNISSCCSL